MGTKIENGIKWLILVLVFVIALLAVIITYIVFNGNYFNMNTVSNYKSNNIMKNVSEGFKSGDLLFEQNEIVYGKVISRLNSKITNNGSVIENLRFKAKFIALDGTLIAEIVGYVGRIKTNETKYVDSYITADISDLRAVMYEIIQ